MGQIMGCSWTVEARLPSDYKTTWGVHALSLGNKREGPVCRLLRGMQGLFIAAFMHAMWLELLRTAKLGTEGTQLALRTGMKVGGAGVKKEKGDISDDDLDADAEIEEGNATVGGVFGNAGNIPVSKEKKGTEQSKGKGKQKGGNGQTSSAPPADEQGLLVVCNGRHGELYASLVFLADGNVKGRTNCCYHSIEAHIGKNPITLNKFAALSGKGSFNKWKQGVVKVQGIGEVPEQNLELLLFNGNRLRLRLRLHHGPQRGRPYGANLGSMGRNTGTWSIRSECLSNITSRCGAYGTYCYGIS